MCPDWSGKCSSMVSTLYASYSYMLLLLLIVPIPMSYRYSWRTVGRYELLFLFFVFSSDFACINLSKRGVILTEISYTIPGNLNFVSSLVIAPNQLKPGAKYRFRLECHYVGSDVFRKAGITVKTNAPPKQGKIWLIYISYSMVSSGIPWKMSLEYFFRIYES